MDEQDSVVRALREMRRLESAAEIPAARARRSRVAIIVAVLLFAGAGGAAIWSLRAQSPPRSKAVRDEGLAAKPPGVASVDERAPEAPEGPAGASVTEDELAGADRLATPAPSSRNRVATGRGRARARGSWGRSDRRAARRDEAVGEPAKGGDADAPLDDVAAPPPPHVAKKRVISDDPLEGLDPPRH